MKTTKRQKLQVPIPQSGIQRNSKLQYSKPRHAARAAVLVFGAWCFFGAWSLVFGASAEIGSGPEISISKTLPADNAHALPKPNWIDQSQAEADKKSRGCLECHIGSESMHASPHVVLGLSLIHISEPTRLGMISYAVFCLKKKKTRR